ncbi:MAG: arylesterase [Oligoflexia bacterium]|nr:arylesterase [Oligoflexia bacterium]
MRKFLSLALLCGLALSAVGYAGAKKRVLILGDSISEGYGISKQASFPSVLQNILQERGYTGVEVIDAGISGSTSASGPGRLRWYLKGRPKAGVSEVLVLELGANDGLRGLSPAEMKTNLRAVIRLAKENAMGVLLVGMKAPPNYGKTYDRDFDGVFPALAREEKVALMPFLLEKVAGEPRLNQEDGIHPNEQGASIVARNVFRYLEPLL